MIVSWPQSQYLTLCLMTVMHIATMLYVTYVKPFNSNLRNFACIFTEMGQVSLHGVLFAFLTNQSGQSQEQFFDYANVFAILLIIIIATNLLFFVIDSYNALLRLGVILNILDPSVLQDSNANRVIDEFSNSDDSLTERNVTLGSRDLGKYGPDYKEDEIEYVDPKEAAKKLEKTTKRPKTPPKGSQPLVSNFGPKTIPLADAKDLIKEGAEEEEKEPDNAGNRTAQQNFATPLAMNNIQSDAPLMATLPLNPIEEEKILGKSQFSKSNGGSTPKEGNLMTPAVS